MLKGRLFISTSAVLGSFGAALYLLPDTVRTDELKKSFQMKIDKADAPLHPKLVNLLSEVSKDLNLDLEKKKLLKPFMSNRLEIVTIGLLQPYFKLHLGIPEFFLLENDSNINITGVINDYKIPPGSIDAEKFKSSVILSKEAKKFALSEKILESQSKTFWMVGFSPICIAAFANSTYKLFLRKTPNFFLKSIFTLHTCILCSWAFLIFKDVNAFYKKASADFQAASLSLDYVKGGIEFYEKLLEKYELIKKFLPDYLHSNDSDYRIIYVFALEVEVRIKYLKDLKKAMETNSKKPSVWEYLLVKDKEMFYETIKSFSN